MNTVNASFSILEQVSPIALTSLGNYGLNLENQRQNKLSPFETSEASDCRAGLFTDERLFSFRWSATLSNFGFFAASISAGVGRGNI